MSSAISETKVKEFMSKDVVTLHADATVHEALQEFVSNRVSALPIVDNEGSCIAIVTATDLIEITYDIDDDFVHTNTLEAHGRNQLVARLSEAVGNESVLSYATESVASVSEVTSLTKAARMMCREQVHHLPVVSEKGLIGVISTMDIVAAVADLG